MYTIPFDVPEITYAESLDLLHSALKFGIQPMLETVVDMLAELGDPDLAFRSVQVAGTNGKTSTSRYTAAILGGEGKKCALYTSPELVSYTERMEVAGRPVSEEAFAHGISAAHVTAERVNARRAAAGERPYDVTEFDTLTVAAMVVFAEAQVDVAVLEVGMGGRWDATSAAKSIEAVCVTGIGLDHTRILGSTLEAIAGEKAAVIKPGRACVLGAGTEEPASVAAVFAERAAAAGVEPVHPGFQILRRPHRIGAHLGLSVTTPRATYGNIAALKPAYQAQNIACAVALAEAFLGRALDAEKLYDSVVTCPTPGRFQLLRPEPPVLIDACHNPQSVETFLTAVDDVHPDRATRPLLLAAVLADKDVEGIARLLASAFPKVAVTQTASPRALPAADLAEIFRAAGADVVATYKTPQEACSALTSTPFVACGSITLAGELAGLFK